MLCQPQWSPWNTEQANRSLARRNGNQDERIYFQHTFNRFKDRTVTRGSKSQRIVLEVYGSVKVALSSVLLTPPMLHKATRRVFCFVLIFKEKELAELHRSRATP